MLKVVLDTNNLVSSQINRRGASAKIYDLWKDGGVEILTSPFQLEELKRVLGYPRIRRKYSLSKTKISQVVEIFGERMTAAYPLTVLDIVKEDPADNQILAIAQEGKADYIISGDQHLLRLRKFKGIPIISARGFLKKVKKR